MKKTIYVIHSVEIEFEENQISEKEAVAEVTDEMYFPCEDTENISIISQSVVGQEDMKEACKTILCEEHEVMRHFWCKDDIRGLETGGRKFTEEEVDAIFEQAERQVDCQYGVNWEYLDQIAQDVAFEAYAEEAEPEEEESN